MTKYIRKILNNDMNIILVPMKNTQVITMGFFVKVGSRNETSENNGIAHFLEHMIFKGTSHRSANQLFSELDSVGAVYNAVTTAQYTYYYIHGNMDSTKKLLDIILDIYINPFFKTQEINREKNVILEEMGMRYDAPLMKLYSDMNKKIFKNTSLERDVIGTPDTINNLKKKDFVDFHKSFYKPENTVFVVTGNFSPKPLYQIIKPILSSLRNSEIDSKTYLDEKEIIFRNMQNQIEPYTYVKKNNYFHQAYVLIAFPMYDLYSYRNSEIDLLSQLLSGGFSSRLNTSLRIEHGITYMSDAYPIVYSDCGLFVLRMIINSDELVRGLKIVMRELKKIKNELISKEELEKIINIDKYETMYSLTDPMDFLTYFGLNFLINRDFKPNFEENLKNINNVTRAQIQDIANEIFDGNKINLFVYGNVNITDFSFLSL